MSLYGVDRDALAELLGGEPRYRVEQVWNGLYSRLATVDEMTDLPARLRRRLGDELRPALELVKESISDRGDTVKFLWSLDGGALVETVLMLYPDRATVCVSSQAGCAMGCGFCATGQAGFTRHLTTGEIVEQVVRAARKASDLGRRAGNVVFMGMGEPLANEEAVWGAVQRLHDDVGLSARHITISTVGIVPGIRRLAERKLPVTLAVSLHAANDELRDELVPINRRYDLEMLMRGVHRLPRRQPAAAELRVGSDRRRQRPPFGRRRARRAEPAPPAGGARQPDPAQPDARVADAWLTSRSGRRISATTSSPSGST